MTKHADSAVGKHAVQEDEQAVVTREKPVITEDVRVSKFHSTEQSGNRLTDAVARNRAVLEKERTLVTGEEARNGRGRARYQVP